MADKINIVTTEAEKIIRWGKEPQDRQRFRLMYFNDAYCFEITKADNDGKFKSKDAKSIAVYFSNIRPIEFANTFRELYMRIKRINDGEKIPKEDNHIIHHNGKNNNIKDATQKITFNIYSNDKEDRKGAWSGYIRIDKKAKDSDKDENAVFFFGGARHLYRASDNKEATDYDVFTFLQTLEEIMKSCGARTNLSRHEHLRRWLEGEKEAKEGNAQGSESKGDTKKKYDKDSDDDEWPF